MESSPSKSKSVLSAETKHSKMSKGSTRKKAGSRSPSFRNDFSFLDVALERYKSRRRAACMQDAGATPVQVTTALNFFREDFGGVSSVRLAPDGSRAVVGFNSGEIRMCPTNPHTRRESMQSTVVMRGWEGNDSVSSIRFLPSDPEVVYAASTDGSVYRARLGSTKRPEAVVTESRNEIYSIDFSASGRHLVTGGRDAAVRVYDAERHGLIEEYAKDLRSSCPTFTPSDFRGHAHQKRVYCVRCHPDDANLIVSGGWDGVVKVWDVRCSHGWARDVPGPFLFGEALDVRAGVVLTAPYDARGALQLWDFGTGGLLRDVAPGGRRVSAVGEHPCAARFFDGDPGADTAIYGGLGTGGLRVVALRENAVRYLFEDDEAVAAVDSVGDKIAFGGQSDSLMVVNFSASVDTSEKSAYSIQSTPQGSCHEETEDSIVSLTEVS